MRIALSPEDIAKRNEVRLPPDKARYLSTVLRCAAGDRLDVIDGRGRAYAAEVVRISGKDVFIAIAGEKPAPPEPALPLILCQGILKGEKMDLVVQKATELGITEIVPLVTERSIVRETRKVRRWAAIAEEAAEQCGRAVIPRIHEPAAFADVLRNAARSEGTRGLIFWEQGGLPLRAALSRLSYSVDAPLPLFVGPEGGFSAEEVREAQAHGAAAVTLGGRILRAETAAIAAVALVQFIIDEDARGR